jgi:hypothetical protein
MNYKSLLKQGNYLTANKIIAKKIGLLESIFISCILDLSEFRQRGGFVTPEGFFEASIDQVKEECLISRDQQITIIKKLTILGLLSTKMIGIPAKRHFKLSDTFDAIIEYLLADTSDDKPSEIPTTGCRKFLRQCVGNSDDYITKNNTNNEPINDKEREKEKNFDLEEEKNDIKANPIRNLAVDQKSQQNMIDRAFELCVVEMKNSNAPHSQLFGYMRNCVKQAISEFNLIKQTNTTIQKYDYYDSKKQESNSQSSRDKKSSWVKPTNPEDILIDENGDQYQIINGHRIDIIN